MPSLNARLAWAVPVDIEVVGAHVDAYAKLQTTIAALRLCHRFGKTDAPISRLPVELLSNIEDLLVEEEREKERTQWHRDYQCFRQECSQRDHYTEEELDEIRMEMTSICSCGGGHKLPAGLANFDDITEDRLDAYLNEDDLTFELHTERMASWTDRVAVLSGRASFLVKHFGLSVWTSTIRVNVEADADAYFPTEWTMAYLILPNGPSAKSSMEYSERDMNIGDFPIETACAIDLTDLMFRPQNVEGRFARALSILNLKPREVDAQEEGNKSPTKGAPHDAVTKTKRSIKSWPRLTILANTME